MYESEDDYEDYYEEDDDEEDEKTPQNFAFKITYLKTRSTMKEDQKSAINQQ